ncbi:MAG: methylamine utilization protein [Rhodoferax sp.]|nr:methylamine utilization protein [Rhodoferax sp.]
MRPGHVAWQWALVFSCARAVAATIDATVLTSAGHPVEDAAVVIEPVAASVPKGKRTVTIEQRDREFIPYVSVVETGTMVEFPNRDAFKHHIYSFSSPKIFEIKLYAGKPVLPVLFDKPGEVALGCNIHDWMEAYVLVVNTPYFARTNAAGRATIRNVPVGHYRLRVWHPRQSSEWTLRDLEIRPGSAPTKLALVADIHARVLKPKPPVDSDKY